MTNDAANAAVEAIMLMIGAAILTGIVIIPAALIAYWLLSPDVSTAIATLGGFILFLIFVGVLRNEGKRKGFIK